MSMRSLFFIASYCVVTLAFIGLAHLTAQQSGSTVSMSAVELPKTERLLPGGTQNGFLMERFG
ncbi:hypothetical protein BTR14_16760 [Rhizobium rhizosphaerae]|uniref:Uncharacterized protein n=1 Tax=Xaviernesmea rhizosphaerae TaxID=1672749 RepID=A0ABX3PA31_9HYPH|nr:hypothetical protein [Xaviernesmea rhizosphaerae]OQP85281.1 hypothetical protein BTR14_16760 [Xaviernesmea rhizosphaerae]